MLEIVFSDSACASLKIAQDYGEGDYPGGCIGVIISHEDGRKPTKKEIKKARQKAREQDYQSWESAVPLGGKQEDVYSFHLALSYGDISEDIPGDLRRMALEKLFDVNPDQGDAARQLLNSSNENLKAVLNRASGGEAIRVWYSNKPDELCGLHWFMARLEEQGEGYGQISLIKQPDLEYDDKQNVIQKNGWGDVEPGEWSRYLPLQKIASPAFIKGCALRWRQLQKENTHLRAVLNGKLSSAPDNIYDGFIRREIEAMPSRFHQAEVIGRVLGHGLGIGDALVAERMEEMLHGGELEVVTKPRAGMPLYHRELTKKY